MHKQYQFLRRRSRILAQIGMDVSALVDSTLVLPRQPQYLCDPAEQTTKQPDPNKTIKLPAVELVY